MKIMTRMFQYKVSYNPLSDLSFFACSEKGAKQFLYCVPNHVNTTQDLET